jgi:ABC-2 type transport system permease protein
MISLIHAIAREEWRHFWRTRIAVAAAALMLCVAFTSLLTGWQQWRSSQIEQQQLNIRNQQEFKAQPDRNPHRMAHYGQFLFRTPGPLAFFDFGIDDFVGRMVYLEAHRQNSANFSNASQSSSLLRFGQITPAFVLQLLYPLLIVFLAFNCVTRERERGMLRLLQVQGTGGTALLLGKLTGQAGIALTLALPLLLAPPVITGFTAASLLISMLYSLYLLLWVAIAVAISAVVSRSRDALIGLVAIWIVATVLVPRVGAQLAATLVPLPSRAETAVVIHKELKKIGDSHNPDDPYFTRFKAEVLRRYGVDSVEALPVDYGGLLLAEGERLTSELFDKYMAQQAALEDRQRALLSRLAVISPLLPIRQLSMALSGSDLDAARYFLVAAENHRYEFVQGLNHLQAEHVRTKGQRISSHHWAELPEFDFTPPSPLSDAGRLLLPATILLAWLAAGAALLVWSGNRLNRVGR